MIITGRNSTAHMIKNPRSDSVLTLTTWVRAGQRRGCGTCAVTQLDPTAGLKLCCRLNSEWLLSRGAPHFHFGQDPTNYIVVTACVRFLIQFIYLILIIFHMINNPTLPLPLIFANEMLSEHTLHLLICQHNDTAVWTLLSDAK